MDARTCRLFCHHAQSLILLIKEERSLEVNEKLKDTEVLHPVQRTRIEWPGTV